MSNDKLASGTVASNLLERACQMALDYLASPNFPHKSPSGMDRKPVIIALEHALVYIKNSADQR